MFGMFKRKLSMAFLSGWLFATFIWNPFQTLVDLNIEKAAEQRGFDEILQRCLDGENDCGHAAMTGTLEIFAQMGIFLTGPFGLGFALGSILFAFWDPIALHFPRFSKKSKSRLMQERARIWKEIGNAITDSIEDSRVDFDYPTMDLPSSVPDEERTRLWNQEMNNHRRGSDRQLRILQRRHNSDLQMALAEIQQFTGDEKAPTKSYQVNHIGWQKAANYLISKATEVENDNS